MWTLAIGIALAAMLALKLAFTGCGNLVLNGDMQPEQAHGCGHGNLRRAGRLLGA